VEVPVALGGGGSGGASAAAGAGSGDAGVGDAGSGAVSPGASACTERLASDSWAVRLADRIITRWSSPRQIMNESSVFQYNSGIVLRGLLEVYRNTCDERYERYIQSYVDGAVDGSGRLDIPAEHSFDNLQPAVLLPFLFEFTGDQRYATAAKQVLDRYDSIPRNAEGGFWHKQQYPNELWCDSIYVGMTPLLAYADTFDDCGDFCIDEPAVQALLLAKHVEQPSGLLRHAWDADANAAWADADGVSPEVWGRALGWYAMAVAEILERLPQDNAQRADLLALFQRVAAGIANAQDGTGLWWQVVDKGSQNGNFLETSSTGMFVYALDLGVEIGALEANYEDVARAGWQGLLDEGRIADAGMGPSVSGAVEGMGVQVDYQNYVNKQQLTDSSHGLVAALLAAVRMER
jgi:unsaturated rhamnogalacturonyl hydrolase